MNLCIIPARGGSKRIPRKNIRNFCGKPIIAWSIETAKTSGAFDRIIVSTDDDEIAEIARQYGAEVPFMRPSYLSDDQIGTTEVVAHAINFILNNQFSIRLVCCFYATAVFVTPQDIRQGLDLLENSDVDYVFPVTTYGYPIHRSLRITSCGRVEMLYPKYFNSRSQDLEEGFHDAGQFYWGRANAWLQGKVLFSPQSVPVILPRYRVQDIDTVEDWIRAEWLFKAMRQATEG